MPSWYADKHKDIIPPRRNMQPSKIPEWFMTTLQVFALRSHFRD